MSENVTVPDGYKMDSKGRLIPVSLIPPIDIIRSDMVAALFEGAVNLRNQMDSFKQDRLKNQVQHSAKVSPWTHTTTNFAQKNAPASCR